jgi:outer membrane protein assembly factor BamB
MRKIALVVLAVGIGVCLLSCEKKEILPGKREALFLSGDDPVKQSNEPVSLPLPTSRVDHICSLGSVNHTSVNHAMNKNPQIVLQKSVACSAVRTEPVFSNGSLFFVDADGILHGVPVHDIRRHVVLEKNVVPLLRVSLVPQKDNEFAGGLAIHGDVVYVSSNVGDVIAFDIRSRKEKWRASLMIPIQGAPVVASGKVIVMTIENQVIALDASSGRQIWRVSGKESRTVMSSFGSPAVDCDCVIFASTTGDSACVSLSNGLERWTDMVLSTNMSESGSAISHVSASPVVDCGMAFFVNAESSACANDVASGVRLWEARIGSLFPLIVLGNSVFSLTSQGSVVCLSKSDGSLKWRKDVLPLQKPGVSAGWVGFLMINSEIALFSSVGDIVFLDSKSGAFLRRIETKQKIATPPIIIDKTMHLLSENGTIIVLK